MADRPNSARPGPPGAGSNTVWIGAAVVAIVVVAAVVAIVSTRHSSNHSSAKVPTGASAPAIVRQVTSVPAGTYDAVDLGSTQLGFSTGTVALPEVGGKPQVLYIGAEYCPYCATQRWAVVAALSRFGTFSNLGLSHSSGDDVYPNTPTFTFHGSRYTSKYVAFTGVETQTNQHDSSGGYTTLDTPTAAQNRIFAAENSKGSIPFIDIGGKYVAVGVGYAPDVLQGKSAAAIAKAMHDPSTAVAKGAIGTANALTAAMCIATHDQPGSVCTSPAVRGIEARLH